MGLTWPEHLADRHCTASASVEHVVTFTRAHFVDALTGVAGCESEHYLSAHFQFSEYIQATPVDLSTCTGISQVDQ